MKFQAAVTTALLLSAHPAFADPLDPVWTPMPPLPDFGELAQIGRSGLCAGQSNGTLLFAGGANFPEPGQTASRGGGKTYYDDALFLVDNEWSTASTVIPVRADSFLSVQDDERVICVGGQGFRPGAEGREDLTTAFTMTFANGDIIVEALPELPAASFLGVGGLYDGTLIATAGMGIFGLDLDDPAAKWIEIAQIPGPNRSVYGGTVVDDTLWIVGGRNRDGEIWNHYNSTHALNLSDGTWSEHADFPIPAGFITVLSSGEGKLATIGGVDEDYFLRIQSQVLPRNEQERGSDAWNELNTTVTWLFDHHPGFMTQVFEYDMDGDAWTQIGWHPGPAPINRSPVPYDGGWILAGGETSAGKRTPYIWRLAFED